MNSNKNLLINHLDLWSSVDLKINSGRGRSSPRALSIYGIKKLRALILDLAVSGKLSDHQNGWRSGKLSDLGVWAVGSGFPSIEQGLADAEILFVKVSDMNLEGNEKYIQRANNSISVDTAKRLKVNVHPPGTIIFPKIGGAIATNKRRILSKRTAIDNNCLGIIPANDILPEWVYLQLSSIDLSKYQAGTSVPALSQGTLGEISISIPDSQEQVNVISKVTELMLICDELEEGGISLDASHERLVEEFLSALTNSQNANEFKKYWVRISDIFDSLFISEGDIDRLKKSILILAVTGRLVEQMPRDGIHQEFNDYSKGNSDYMLPESWILAKLGEIGEASIGLTYSPNDISNNGIPVLRSTNIQNGLIDLTELVRVSTVIKPSLFLRKDDLLICSRNGSKSLVGKSALIEGLNEPMTFGAFMAVLRSPYARYIKIFLDSDLFRRLLNGVETTTINQITQNNLKNTLIPLPPLEEQHRIVERVSHLFLVCDNLKSLIFHANKQQQLIADVLVDQALA